MIWICNGRPPTFGTSKSAYASDTPKQAAIVPLTMYVQNDAKYVNRQHKSRQHWSIPEQSQNAARNAHQCHSWQPANNFTSDDSFQTTNQMTRPIIIVNTITHYSTIHCGNNDHSQTLMPSMQKYTLVIQSCIELLQIFFYLFSISPSTHSL